MSRYEIVRDTSDGIQRHPEQPEDGFPTALDAAMWSDCIPRELQWQWYIRPVGD